MAEGSSCGPRGPVRWAALVLAVAPSLRFGLPPWPAYSGAVEPVVRDDHCESFRGALSHLALSAGHRYRHARTCGHVVIVGVTTLGSTKGGLGRAVGQVVDYLEGVDRDGNVEKRRSQPGSRPHSSEMERTAAPGAYYADSAERPGRWLGSGADHFALGPSVDPQMFDRVLLPVPDRNARSSARELLRPPTLGPHRHWHRELPPQTTRPHTQQRTPPRCRAAPCHRRRTKQPCPTPALEEPRRADPHRSHPGPRQEPPPRPVAIIKPGDNLTIEVTTNAQLTPALAQALLTVIRNTATEPDPKAPGTIEEPCHRDPIASSP